MRTVVRVARAREAVRQRGFVSAAQRNYFPFDTVYRYDEKGIMQVVADVWPECAGAGNCPSSFSFSFSAAVATTPATIPTPVSVREPCKSDR